MPEELNVENAVDSIASDIGLTHEEEAAAPVEESETEPVEEASGPETVSTAPAPRPAPKAWAKEQHERWGKIDKDTQDYIELREKQMLDGLSQYGEAAKAAKAWDDTIKDYAPIIQAQGITPHQAVKYLFDAHRQLSSGTPEQKAAYLAQVAKSYGIDFAKATATAAAAAEEPAAVKELRERTERLEKERAAELRQRQEETSKRVAGEVNSFAEAKDEKGNPKHPYFDECAEDIVALIHAGHTLEQAYEKAVYANPVTRAKELERLRKADEEALRAKAKQEAEKARNASRTNVISRDTKRAPTASKAAKWEDTLDDTMKEIKARETQH